MWERREHEGERGLLKVSRLVRKDVEGESRTTGRGEGREARFYSYVSAMHSSGVKGIVCCYRNSQLTSSHKSKECTLFVPDSSLAFFSALSTPAVHFLVTECTAPRSWLSPGQFSPTSFLFHLGHNCALLSSWFYVTRPNTWKHFSKHFNCLCAQQISSFQGKQRPQHGLSHRP